MGASGRLDRSCRVCSKNFADCPHSVSDEMNKKEDDHIRKIVRDELKKAGLVV